MKRRHGFSLLEVLVALTLLAVAIIAIMRLFPNSLRQSRTAAERTAIASLARTEMGRVKAGGIANLLKNWAPQNALMEIDKTLKAYALYNGWTSTVQRVGGRVDLFRITFNVTMFDGREEQFVTYVTEL